MVDGGLRGYGMRLPGGRATAIGFGAAGGIVVALVLAQLVLPAIAARIARDQVGKYGAVRSVSVHALPAIELLWGHAESATRGAPATCAERLQLDGLLPDRRGSRSST